jgi:hypothetical protein
LRFAVTRRTVPSGKRLPKSITRFETQTHFSSRWNFGEEHPAFGGSYSLKDVLPALLPDMTYEGMALANGTDAGIAFARMIDPSISRDENASLREALLRYCEQDTLALVRILERMYAFANSPKHVTIPESVPGDYTLNQTESRR